jgi:hypothetical protein
LIQQLAGLLLTGDQQSVLCALGILSNLTADNRTNKSLLVKLNGVQTLMQKLMMNTEGNDELIEAALCTLRHLTARHDLEHEAREAIRKSYGIGNIVKLLRDKNAKEHWGTIKATVGLIKNLALSPTIIPQLCEQNAVRRLIELLTMVERERMKIFEETHSSYVQQFDLMIEIILGALTHLAKDPSSRSIMKEGNYVALFTRVSAMIDDGFFHFSLPVFSVTVVSIATSVDCSSQRIEWRQESDGRFFLDSSTISFARDTSTSSITYLSFPFLSVSNRPSVRCCFVNVFSLSECLNIVQSTLCQFICCNLVLRE